MKYYNNLNNFNKINSMKLFCRDIMLIIVQIITIYNAKKLGWHIEKINKHKYKLFKKIDNMESDFNLNLFIKEIVNC